MVVLATAAAVISLNGDSSSSSCIVTSVNGVVPLNSDARTACAEQWYYYIA
jgi:hypothetical protein